MSSRISVSAPAPAVTSVIVSTVVGTIRVSLSPIVAIVPRTELVYVPPPTVRIWAGSIKSRAMIVSSPPELLMVPRKLRSI